MHLYFWSPTCGPCRRISPKVDAAIEAGAPIRKLDVSTDTGRYVARLFGITATPALVKVNKTIYVGDVAVAKEFE
ncbi:thioredoxin 1/thioredoxin 2 [Streptosporangium canum]|uniref:Thioredoxin 1/thioredoxin 2 n=1 Tax=Streptosporangium canum TaxID=324952 RepID=A0A1I3L5S6_9ACTN|nr:thioredoxin family protein [Streptosporangium canum]SFI80071.1 thioredoxin 1/thioredoxin 2 [Streptosporangium canum]